MEIESETGFQESLFSPRIVTDFNIGMSDFMVMSVIISCVFSILFAELLMKEFLG